MNIFELGDLLRGARVAKKLTQKEAAEAAGLHISTVRTLEQGTAMDIGVRKLSSLLEVLDYEVNIRPKGQSQTLDDLAREQAYVPSEPLLKRVRKSGKGR